MMAMNRFAYANGSSVEEIVAVLDEGCRPLAGGTDLLGLMKEGLIAPERLVNIKTIPGLDQVQEREDGLHIGALVSLSQLAAHPCISHRQEFVCLYESIVQAASPQIRHMATVAGNLVQQPRCWYFRNRLVPCWRKGGQRCFAVRGESKYHTILGRGPCHAVHPSDPAVALLALGSSVEIAGPGGQRTVPLSDFYRLPTRDVRQDTLLALEELITGIFVPTPPIGSQSSYVKVAERGSWDFALVSVAVWLAFSGEVVQEARVVLGGVAPMPWSAVEAEQSLIGKSLTPEVLAQAAEAATAGARPLQQNGYKIDLVHGALRQVLRDLG
jgi:xanthine dehydrogenase YagS FAD-binding subunit